MDIKNLGVVNATIRGTSHWGSGILGGLFYNFNVENCYTTGSVITTYTYYVGGFIGDGFSTVIKNCYSRASVQGSSSNNPSGFQFIRAGGFMGRQYSGTNENCYSTGLVLVSGTDALKFGFAYSTSSPTVTNCYFDWQTSECNAQSNEYATPKSTAQMKTQSTFNGWNFTNIWMINGGFNDGYPVNKIFYLTIVHTQAVTSITKTTATGNGTITNLGYSNPTAHGFCWNTTGNPTTSDSFIDNGATNSLGAYTGPVTLLSDNTLYYIRAYATNDYGTFYGEQYSFYTAADEPTIQASNITFTLMTGNILKVGWTNGNGLGRVVFAKQANTGTAAPVDNEEYTANSNFGLGEQIGSTGWYCIYNGTGTSVDVTGLNGGYDYIFQVFEYNSGLGMENYMLNTTVNNPNVYNVINEPTVQAANIIFTLIGENTLRVGWTNGNGLGRAVFVKQANTGTAAPVDNEEYTANSNFGSGEQIGSTGWYCIYNGTGTTVDVTGLIGNNDYIFQVFEYNNGFGMINYYLNTGVNNPNVYSIVISEPTIQAVNIVFDNIKANLMNINWTKGNGAKRVVFAKQADSGLAEPVDDEEYTANSNFGQGEQIGSSGWYCVYNGTSESILVTGLTSSTNYIFQVFEYNNGFGKINYLISTSSNNPKVQATNNFVDYALKFDGSLTYVNCYAKPVFNISGNNITLEALINISNINQMWQPIVGKQTGEDGYYGLLIVGNTKKTGLYLNIGGSWGERVIASTVLEQDTWYHIAAVYDGSNAYMYINGSLNASRPCSGNLTQNSAIPVYIGMNNTVNFNGYIDEVRIWNIARTQAQINEYKFKELIGDESGLVAYYKMSDGSGTTLTDNGLNGCHGLLTNENNTSSPLPEWVASSSPLPVEINLFVASFINNKVILDWQTVTEINNYGFEIERAQFFEGVCGEFSRIGFVKGHGNSNAVIDYTFTDPEVKFGKYAYRLKQVDIDGKFNYSGVIEIEINNITSYCLEQNYPNPFNPITTISYALPKVSKVTLKVFDLLGKEITTLVNETQESGIYNIQFNASNLSSGIYYYRIEADGFIQIKKMALIK